MLFSSLEFLFLFLPVVLAVYFLLPKKFRNGWLFVSGLFFYGFGEPRFLPLMLFTVTADFLLGLWVAKRLKKGDGRGARVLLIIAVVLNIGQLAFFKYFNFFGFGLPIGISFYTFQALSYVIDVYRRQAKANRSYIDFGAYVVLFPQLIAGPIVRYTEISSALRQRAYTWERISDGLRIFCVGLAKKVILANPSGRMWQQLALDNSFFGAYLGIFFFSMQIYFDFSGYSDMAVGLGRALGFDFPQNFNYPYISKSITDFWRRWHITLSSWFREYVYIPLGGNRKGKLVTCRNLFLTWMLTGIWHGAELNFLLWGVYFAIILMIEKFFLAKLLKRLPDTLAHAYALFLIALGWVIFASDGSISGFSGVSYALRLFGVGCDGFCSDAASYQAMRTLPFAVILILGSTPLPRRIYVNMKKRTEGVGARKALTSLLLNTAIPSAVFLLSVAYAVSSGYDPFLYFRF